jgi:predicted RNase H-like nuclease (RuvC/YqgF family)
MELIQREQQIRAFELLEGHMPQTATYIQNLTEENFDLNRTIQVLQRELKNLYQQCQHLSHTNNQQNQWIQD